MSKEPKKLDELFHETLKDIYFAEKKLLTALPKLAKAAESEELKAAFEKHAEETQGHVERLEQVFELIEEDPHGKTCDAILGLVEEAQEVMKEFKDSPALDAGLIASAQAAEHYEISRYGTLKTWAEELGLKDAVSLLDATLAEEKKTDELLTQLAPRTEPVYSSGVSGCGMGMRETSCPSSSVILTAHRRPMEAKLDFAKLRARKRACAFAASSFSRC